MASGSRLGNVFILGEVGRINVGDLGTSECPGREGRLLPHQLTSQYLSPEHRLQKYNEIQQLLDVNSEPGTQLENQV